MRRRSAFLAVSAVAATAAITVPSIATSPSHGDTAITSVVVNDGRTVVLGADRRETFRVSVTATDDSGIRSVSPVGVWGPKYGILKVSPMRCVRQSATTSTCTGTVSVDTGRKQVWNDEAGTWFVDAQANANDGDDARSGAAGGFSLKRASRLGVYGLPARAPAGSRATAQGWLSRVWWDSGDYHGSPDDHLQLLFRPDGGDTWTPVADEVTNPLGQVSAGVRLTRSGWYRWVFAGSKWTGPARSKAVHVAVR
ncbi:hypothetical protein LO771_06540 [Streptacidiphilus sp. ASG 303]|uniref:hypothetical protein n=1 Tax=Streptacidiphilus sp. ASG 303 TaxID=2896847 RepID=UPI001E48F73F|nr:hypothetical protein [Streptacidiphilus sp. ASG 303]MCD0482082.1 hypothetical protein [Streptacidiphilus sp. ASG 303]